MFVYAILGVCIGYFSGILFDVIKEKIRERSNDKNDNARFSSWNGSRKYRLHN